MTPALKSQALIGDPWCCSISATLAKKIALGSQIRIRRNSSEYAVYTVSEIRSKDGSDQVRMSYVARQRLATTKSFAATLLPALATKSLSDSAAEDAGEFIERIDDPFEHQGLVVLAPHGGHIEINTDKQARRVTNALAGADVSSWICRGWKNGGGSYDCWHVTSTDINPASFPGLATLADRNFAYAVAFHGMGSSGVRIGGAGPYELKKMIRQAIKAAIGSSAGPVEIAGNNDALSGTSSNNVVNWITAGGDGGIQIEQSKKVRTKHWKSVSDAVAGVFADLL